LSRCCILLFNQWQKKQATETLNAQLAREPMKQKAKEVKIKNIIDMAVSFSAMARVFEKGSAEKIKARLNETIEDFLSLKSSGEYYEKHDNFCSWFVSNIKTTERLKNDKIIKESHLASWGQAAKILDIVLKVCIYYCNLPSVEDSSRILPWLNGAIDTPIMEDLKKRYSPAILSQTNTIESIDRQTYEELQKLIRNDIRKAFNNEIFAVQYDDIKWRELNR
jgi:uncharacterized protein (DUF2267 family)